MLLWELEQFTINHIVPLVDFTTGKHPMWNAHDILPLAIYHALVAMTKSGVECTRYRWPREHGQLTVSKNLIPNSSASACPFAVGTAWQNAVCRLASHRVEGVNCDAVSGLFSKYKKHPTNFMCKSNERIAIMIASLLIVNADRLSLITYPFALIHVSLIANQDFIDVVWSM